MHIYKEAYDESENDSEMPKLINADKNVNISNDKSQYFISKKRLTHLDVDTNDKIGHLLGYNCSLSQLSRYIYSFHFISKSKKDIHLFSYSCESPEKISEDKLIYAKKLTDKIKAAFKKYPEINSKLDVIIAKINDKTKK